MKHIIEYISETSRNIESDFRKLHIATKRLLNRNFYFISDIKFSYWDIYIYCNGLVEGDCFNSIVRYEHIDNDFFNISVNNANPDQILELKTIFNKIEFFS